MYTNESFVCQLNSIHLFVYEVTLFRLWVVNEWFWGRTIGTITFSVDFIVRDGVEYHIFGTVTLFPNFRTFSGYPIISEPACFLAYFWTELVSKKW